MADNYTLLVPTYNRPEQLNRLLTFLERTGATFPVLVLDSSAADIQEKNQRSMSHVGLRVERAAYDQAIDPYAKLGEGFTAVRTPYCSVCADDDVVVPSAVRRCISALESDSEAAMAHGLYFNFQERETFDLSCVTYRGPSITDRRALGRLQTLFARYEAVLYGVFRTEAASEAFRDVGKVSTTLGKELLTAGLSLVAGKALRTADFYYGRNSAESLSYSAWHPHQILADKPEQLFLEYPTFRHLLLQGLQRAEPGSQAGSSAKIVDLILLRYLEPFLRHDVLDLIIDRATRGDDSSAILARVWDTFVRTPRSRRPIEPLIGSRGGYSPKLLGSGRPRDYEWSSRSHTGNARKYRVYYEFFYPDFQPPLLVDREQLMPLLDLLNAY